MKHKEMKDHRQGNDLAVLWSIFKDGEPFDLRGRSLKLYLKNLHERKEVVDFSVTGNEIHWTFYGKDQDTLGKHSLILVANEDEKGMITTDACDFVRLVSCSCKLQGGEDSPNVETESIVLTSTLEYVAGGGSYDDTAVWNELEKKVDKEEGLGLSEENYTTEEKEKLAGLENYDDSAIKGELAKKAEKSEIPTKLSELEQDVEIGTSYDDTELREAISLRNVGAEDTDESVEEPEIPIPAPSASNEWKCVVDRRLLEGEKNIIFTTYADGTPLQAKEVMVQILCDKEAAQNVTGYVGIKSTNNQTETMYGSLNYEKTSVDESNQLLQHMRICASPFFTIAEMSPDVKCTVATQTTAYYQGGNLKTFQIYEDIVYVRINANAALTSAAPYLKIYAR